MKYVSPTLLVLGVLGLGYDWSCHALNAWAFSRPAAAQNGWLYRWWYNHAAEVWPHNMDLTAWNVRWTVIHGANLLFFVAAWATKGVVR